MGVEASAPTDRRGREGIIFSNQMRPSMTDRYVFDLRSRRVPPRIGHKADKLRFLTRNGFRAPASYACTWDAYLRYLDGDVEMVEGLRAELSESLDPAWRYAVRSSANVEDGLDHSFAGQFKSVLNAQVPDQVLEAIWSIWATTQSPGVEAYLARNGIDPQDLKMAILIQEMVQPVISGVSFSKNPMTGLDEVVVEAVEGSGESLVQRGHTPRRWVYKWGDWILEPEENGIPLDLVQEVVEQTQAIARAYGEVVDLEWVYDGEAIYWVQLREVTSLNVDIYSNQISREVFPGLIKPLIWSVNVPLVNGAWIRLFTELIGPNEITPESLARSFYYRAYFNMGAIGQIFEALGFPREALELLNGLDIGGPDKPSFRPTTKVYTHLPRMVRFAIHKLRFARRVEAFLPSMERQYRDLPTDQADRMDERALIEQIDRLFELAQETAYYNIVTPLLMQVYNRLLKSQLGRMGIDFEKLDLTGDLEEMERYEPNAHLARLNQQVRDLDPALREALQVASYDEFLHMTGIDALRVGVERFTDQFGHLSDSGNDFSSVPWREDPDLVLKMVLNYAEREGGDSVKIHFEDLELPSRRGPLLRWIYRRARRFRFYREAIGSLYTFGYGLFRIYFLALGDHFVQRQVLSSRDDVFYLYFDEVREIVEGDGVTDYQTRVAQRKREIEAHRDVIPPTVVYGEEALPLEPSAPDVMRGTATSRGRYTGPTRVVQGIRDLDKVKEGDVLVVPFSDVGWTPLFAKAGAVIAESGGLLSHSSIVAREYGIPAVVSVPGACQLPDDLLVTVDGYRGEIQSHTTDQSRKIAE
jgi:pyruvate,water dikinase